MFRKKIILRLRWLASVSKGSHLVSQQRNPDIHGSVKPTPVPPLTLGRSDMFMINDLSERLKSQRDEQRWVDATYVIRDNNRDLNHL